MNSIGLNIRTFALGPWMTNCYVVSAGEPCWIIDCGMEPGSLLDYIDDQQLTPQAVLLTHAHFDHIAGLAETRRRWPQLPIMVHSVESQYLTRPTDNLSAFLDSPIHAPEPTGTLAGGSSFSFGDVTAEIRHTPGHSPGSVSFYLPDERVVFGGDTLFLNSIGRTDFPHSDPRILQQSIRMHLLSLPDDTTVHPGHGPSTTVGRERTSNPFLTGEG